MKHILAVGRKYGWRPELPVADIHKKLYLPRARTTGPIITDYRPQCPPVYDQGQIGSCVANAIAGAYDFKRGQEGLAFLFPSRLFIYANARLAEQTPLDQDSGCCVCDAADSVTTQGVCPETEWPYVESQFSVQPPSPCYADALKDLVLEKQAVDVNDIAAALADGNIVAGGLTLYESFESDTTGTTGIVPMPQAGDTVAGGHGIDLVGCDTTQGIYIGRNSWSAAWGQAGYFVIPVQYVQQYGSDFWALQKVE